MSLPSASTETTHVWIYSYDAEGNRITAVNHLGQTTVMSFDAEGWPVSTVPPVGYGATHPSTFASTASYDALGDETADTAPPTSSAPKGITSTYTYNHDQEVTRTVDNAGHATTKAYDATDRLCWTIPKSESSRSCTAPPTGSTEYTYNGNSEVLTVEDGDGHTTHLFYTDAAFPTKVTEDKRPDGTNKTLYVCSTSGNLTTTTDPMGHVTTDQYNAANELCYVYQGTTTAKCASGPAGSITYTYDANGQRAK
jgi:YD repeat-containing protein